MEDRGRETATEAAKNGLKDDDLELSLGLRPATIRRGSNSLIPAPDSSGDLSLMTVPIWGKDSEKLGFELEAKKEAQALRRQEARKKREEKRKSKANSNERMLWFEKQRALGRENEGCLPERRRKGEGDFNGNESEGAVPVPATTSFSVRPPISNGASYYTMMPGLVGSDGQLYQPVAGGGGFRPYQAPEKNCGFSRGSSPGFSDYRSSSGQGGSISDSGSHSSNTQPAEATIDTKSQTIPNPQPLTTKRECTTQTEASADKKPSQSPSAVTNEAKPSEPPVQQTRTEPPVEQTNEAKPTKPPVQQTNEAMLLSQMPYVSTTGNGPNARTVTGFLYKYSNTEVCIVCVCHGTCFSPSGFVQHAGGVDVENPLRHITVVPFGVT